MVELRQAAAELIANPLVPVPPIEGVVARARAIRSARRRRQMSASMLVVAMVVTALARAGLLAGTSNDSLRMVGNPVQDDGVEVSGLPPLGNGSNAFPTLPWSGQQFEAQWPTVPVKRKCTVVREPKPELPVLIDGPAGADDLFSDVAVEFFDALNKAGGICGRHVQLVRGVATTAPLDKYVAALGMPLEPDLDEAIAAGRFARAGVPVVSGDGLTAVQHRSPLVYPVGPSAASMVRAAVDDGRARGATSFAVVYDVQHAFGREAAATYDQHVRRRGGTVKASIGLHTTSPSYAVQAEQLASACGSDGCDFVLLALLPDSAARWLAINPNRARTQLVGLSPMLSDGYHDYCTNFDGRACDGLRVWSGYRPLMAGEGYEAEVAHAWKGDHPGALRQGVIMAARVLHEALRQAGPDATAADVRRALDSMTFTSRVAPTLSWPDGKFRGGHPVAQAWVLRSPDSVPVGTTKANLSGGEGSMPVEIGNRDNVEFSWHPAGTGWVRDPGER